MLHLPSLQNLEVLRLSWQVKPARGCTKLLYSDAGDHVIIRCLAALFCIRHLSKMYSFEAQLEVACGGGFAWSFFPYLGLRLFKAFFLGL